MEIDEKKQSLLSFRAERNVPENKNRAYILNIAIMAIFTALETIMTASISIPIPATTGYFNIGEGIIYFSAIMFGPGIGAFVGGVGAAIADILTPYAIFAPGTLIAKGAEGFIVGWIFKILKNKTIFEKHWKTFSLFLGLFIGAMMMILADGVLPIIILGLILMVLTWILGFTVQKDIGQKLLAMIPGGIIMVLGYFFYESLILNLISPGYYMEPLNAALIEVPINLLQVLSGIFIAIPLIATLEPVVKTYYK